MPNTASAKKRLRQNETRRAQNRVVKTGMRSQVKKVRAAISDGDIAKAEEEFRLAAKHLDRAGAKRVIHPNTAGRYKSRLQQAIKTAKQASS